MKQCTLYLTLVSPDDLIPLLAAHFTGWKMAEDPDEGSVILTKKSLFSRRRLVFYPASKNEGDERCLNLLRQTYDFYSAVEAEKPDVKEMFLAQINVFTLTVGVVGDKSLDNRELGALLTLAGDGCGLLLLPPSDFFNGEGRLVLNADGVSEVDEHTVQAPAGLLERQLPQSTPSGEERKARTNALLELRGIPVCASLPPLVGDEDFRPRDKEETAARTLALLLVAAYADILRGGTMEEARDFFDGMVADYGAAEFFSPEEAAFLENPEPDEDAVSNMIWRYECAWVGLWALGIVKELPYPEDFCDIEAMAEIAQGCSGFAELLDRAAPLEPADILEQADFIYRCGWACVEAQVKGTEAAGELHCGVVTERHKMLNWLIRSMDAEWDEVRTDT